MNVRFYVALLRSGKHKSVYIPGADLEVQISNQFTMGDDIAQALSGVDVVASDLRIPGIAVIKRTKDYLLDHNRSLDDFIKITDITTEV